MNQIKTIPLIAILTAAIILLIPTVSLAADPTVPVVKTGQTTCYDAAGIAISCADTGQDGDLQKGVASPSSRFTDNGDGTVTDNLTGLMWAKDANIFGIRTWTNALSDANDLSLGNAGCGASYTDWRLPNSNELQTLIDKSNYNPALPTGHPFTNVQSNYYWSSTTYAFNTGRAWFVFMHDGYVVSYNKTYSHYVWPVRSDN